MPMYENACPKGWVAHLSLQRYGRQFVSFLASSDPRRVVLIIGLLHGWFGQIHLPLDKLLLCSCLVLGLIPNGCSALPNQEFGRPSSLHDVNVTRALHCDQRE